MSRIPSIVISDESLVSAHDCALPRTSFLECHGGTALSPSSPATIATTIVRRLLHLEHSPDWVRENTRARRFKIPVDSKRSVFSA